MTSTKLKMTGMNLAAFEIGDIDDALAFWGGIFEIKLR